jgi:hypothetical protein
MSRGFKPKPKPAEAENANLTRIQVKKKVLDKQRQQNPAVIKKEPDLGVTLVEATPEKNRVIRTQSQSQQWFLGRTQSFSSQTEGGLDEDDWQLASSPDLLAIYSGRQGVDSEAVILAENTPTKRKSAPRG